MDEKLKKRLAEIDRILDGIPIPVKENEVTLDVLGMIIDELRGYLDGKNPDKEKWVLTDRLLKKIGKIQKKCKKKELKIPELEDVIVKPKKKPRKQRISPNAPIKRVNPSG
jgi:hemerythrin-like domain-containing protein